MGAMKKTHATFDEILRELSNGQLDPEVIRKPVTAESYASVVADSRKALAGSIFCALKGISHDGHKLIADLGPMIGIAIVEDTTSEFGKGSCGIVKVKSTRAAWAQLASFFSGHPSRQLTMIGITGTNGKTSTTWMLKGILDSLGIKSASLGTLGFYLEDEHLESQHTTPDPDVLYPLLQDIVTRSITHVVMEVSSHSLVQGKVWPIQFSGAAFTSFSQDHLDFHKDMDDYLDAKLLLFSSQLKAGGAALVHESILGLTRAAVSLRNLRKDAAINLISYGTKEEINDFAVKSKSFLNLGFSRIKVTQKNTGDEASPTIPMIGDVFSENFAAALILTSTILQKPLKEISARISSTKIKPVPGRLELVRVQDKPWRPLVYVDYAHTPDALEKSIKNLLSPRQALTAVFGCGGDRDKLKRPLMGDLAAKLAHEVIITSDNPRTEDPGEIIQDISRGISDQTKARTIQDRRAAIAESLRTGGTQKTVLIAGKGHEDYQIVGHEKSYFSDQAEAMAALRRPKTWLVFGAGVSGFSAATLLADAGDTVYLSDDRPITPPAELPKSVIIVSPSDIPWSLIEDVVLSPGVPPENKSIQHAKGAGLECITEIDLGFDRYVGSIIAVTGTNGKSTTVAMVESLLKRRGFDAIACGNIGLPPTALGLWKKSSEHTAVVELSSYQLEGCLSWPASAAAITSFSSDHLARHKTIENYFLAKWSITNWLEEGSIFVVSCEVALFAQSLNLKWPTCRTVVIAAGEQKLPKKDGLEFTVIKAGHCRVDGIEIDLESFGLKGSHNQLNGLTAAIICGHRTATAASSWLPELVYYKPLPYRCELVFEDDERIIVNDSKSTNLESTLAALSVAKKPAILLMGGQGKGESYQPLLSVRDRIKHLIAFGASRDEIVRDAPKGIQTDSFEKMSDAVLRALELAGDNKWDVIFSPGCASFDEFKNFEQRGLVFNQLVADFHRVKHRGK